MFALLITIVCISSVLSFSFKSARATSSLHVSANGETSALKMAVDLPPLPYEYTSLEPFLGEQTLRIHHDKHHAKYVATTNSM